MWEPVEACGRRGSMWKTWKHAEDVEACGSKPGTGGSQWKPVEAVEDMWKLWKICGRQGRSWKGCRRCGTPGRGPEGHGKVRKRREGTGSNGTLRYLV